MVCGYLPFINISPRSFHPTLYTPAFLLVSFALHRLQYFLILPSSCSLVSSFLFFASLTSTILHNYTSHMFSSKPAITNVCHSFAACRAVDLGVSQLRRSSRAPADAEPGIGGHQNAHHASMATRQSRPGYAALSSPTHAHSDAVLERNSVKRLIRLHQRLISATYTSTSPSTIQGLKIEVLWVPTLDRPYVFFSRFLGFHPRHTA